MVLANFMLCWSDFGMKKRKGCNVATGVQRAMFDFDTDKKYERLTRIKITSILSPYLCEIKKHINKSPPPPQVYANPNDELCSINFLTFIRSICEPDQDRAFCVEANVLQRHEFWVKKPPFKYKKYLPLRENTIAEAKKYSPIY
jgi:hypothetical protein